MIPKQWLMFALGLIVLLSVTALFLSAPKEDLSAEEQLAQLEAESELPNVVGDNVSFVVTEGERKKWRLIAEKAYYYEDQTGARLENVSGVFYNMDGEPILNFKAPAGAYRSQNNAVTLTGGVLAQSTDEEGGQLTAPQMTWNARSKEVLAEGGNVLLDFPQGISRAERCRFTLDFSMISLEGEVTSDITY